MGCKRKERVNIYSNIQGLHSCGEKWNCHLLSYGRLEEEQNWLMPPIEQCFSQMPFFYFPKKKNLSSITNQNKINGSDQKRRYIHLIIVYWILFAQLSGLSQK